MTQWRQAREQKQSLAAAKQAALEKLIERELQASAQRAAAMLNELTQ